jgi:hypothetical protein
MKTEKDKIVTVRLPRELWKKLSIMKVNGKIESIQAAAIRGLEMVISENK